MFDHLLKELYPVPLPPPPAQFATRRLSVLLACGAHLRSTYLWGTGLRLEMVYSLEEIPLKETP